MSDLANVTGNERQSTQSLENAPLIALPGAIALLVNVVLPAEYGVWHLHSGGPERNEKP